MSDDPRSRLEQLATQRTQSFLTADWTANVEALHNTLSGAKVLVIGGAGSIGGAFAQELAAFPLKALHLQDISENGLVEVIRTLRARGKDALSDDIRTFAFDYGAPFMGAFLQTHGYDFIFNFSAVKHVRSERDPYSLAHLLDTNIVKMKRLCGAVLAVHPARFFTLSTDKAACSTTLMGASKRFMERLAFSLPRSLHVTSTRFANVAFSAGSLLEGWCHRLDKRHPLPVPAQTRRYFISHQEAAQICLLTSLRGPSHHLTVPTFQEHQALLLEDIAEGFVTFHGYTPQWFEDAQEAIDACSALISQKKWPILKTPRDTTGEKECEIFVEPGEDMLTLDTLTQLCAVPYSPSCTHHEDALASLETLLNGPLPPSFEQIVPLIKQAVPSYTPAMPGKNLDSRL